MQAAFSTDAFLLIAWLSNFLFSFVDNVEWHNMKGLGSNCKQINGWKDGWMGHDGNTAVISEPNGLSEPLGKMRLTRECNFVFLFFSFGCLVDQTPRPDCVMDTLLRCVSILGEEGKGLWVTAVDFPRPLLIDFPSLAMPWLGCYVMYTKDTTIGAISILSPLMAGYPWSPPLLFYVFFFKQVDIIVNMACKRRWRS
jgi:hypothetical protein